MTGSNNRLIAAVALADLWPGYSAAPGGGSDVVDGLAGALRESARGDRAAFARGWVVARRQLADAVDQAADAAELDPGLTLGPDLCRLADAAQRIAEVLDPDGKHVRDRLAAL